MEPFLIILLFVALYFFLFIIVTVEIAFFALTKKDMDVLNKENDFERKIIIYRRKPREIILTSITTTTIFLLALGVLIAYCTKLIAHNQLKTFTTINLLIWFFVQVLVVILIGGILPRIYAVANPIQTLRRFLPAFFLFYKIFYPVVSLLRLITTRLAILLGVHKESLYVSESFVSAIVEVEQENDHVTEEERKMIRGVMEFGDKTAKEIMVPRPDVVFLSVDINIPDAIRLVKESHRSRIPVYEENIDHIVGILYAKDLLGELPENATIRSLCRAAHSVPEYKKVDELLREMLRLHIHMAIVIDEYGGTSGVVTLEDIVEEIIGEIQDEYDRDTKKIEIESENSWIVEASFLTSELNRELDTTVVPESDEYDTIGGYILSIAGRVPDIGEEFAVGNWKFIVVNKSQTRIKKIRIIKEEVVQDTEDESE
ncbi:MAG: hemolysin family protein [bacterium]|nr:hemolysin family protein [bacterium]